VGAEVGEKKIAKPVAFKGRFPRQIGAATARPMTGSPIKGAKVRCHCFLGGTFDFFFGGVVVEPGDDVIVPPTLSIVW